MGYVTLNTYAWLLLTCEPVDLRDPEAALALAKKAADAAGARKPDVLDTLALAYRMTGDLDNAIKTRRQALGLLPPGDSSRRNWHEKALVELLKEKGQLSGVAQVYRSVVERRRASLPEADPAIGEALVLLGETLVEQQKFSEAEPILREALEIAFSSIPEDRRSHPYRGPLGQTVGCLVLAIPRSQPALAPVAGTPRTGVS